MSPQSRCTVLDEVGTGHNVSEFGSHVVVVGGGEECMASWEALDWQQGTGRLLPDWPRASHYVVLTSCKLERVTYDQDHLVEYGSSRQP